MKLVTEEIYYGSEIGLSDGRVKVEGARKWDFVQNFIF